MKVNNKPNFFKRLLNDKTKMSFIIMAISIFIVGGVLTGLYFGGVINHDKAINDIAKWFTGGATALFTFLSTMFALLRNGTKTREQKTLETLKAIETLHTKITIINKQVKKLKKGKDNG